MLHGFPLAGRAPSKYLHFEAFHLFCEPGPLAALVAGLMNLWHNLCTCKNVESENSAHT